tara:strand:+ start:596 stop:1324 length:729 start_codon:yes stop_codon:yes gene_type:complete
MPYRPIRLFNSAGSTAQFGGDVVVTGAFTAGDFKISDDLKISGSLHVGDSSLDAHIFSGSTSFDGSVNLPTDKFLFFGNNNECSIKHSGSQDYLVISGSTNGIVLSGSHVIVDQKLGVGIPNSDITHAITLPNNDNTTGQIKANAFVSYSSQRYKKDIEVLNDPMDVLNRLNGVSFKWKDTERLDYGFIAEDVGKVLPGIVSWEDNKKDAQGMDYLKIISFLVEAVKKQQKQIDELNQKLKK